jgi:hypothetical protein
MINVSFIYYTQYNGYPSWIGYDGTTQLIIQWNGLYWEMLGWPYDGEPRNYNNTLNPTTGWALYNNTTLTATFDIVLGACALPTPTPTATISKTPTPSVTPGVTRTPTPTPTPSQTCIAPVLNSVVLVGSHASNYTFNLFFTPSSQCNDMIYEYSCDGSSWTSCGYDECGSGFGCISPIQITIDSVDGCIICGSSWYFRIKQCCPNGLQSNLSNIIQFTPATPTPTPTISISKTPSRTPSITPTISKTPSISVTPSLTPTPTPSTSPGNCRYLKGILTVVRRSTYATIQYTKCGGTLDTFDVYLPGGTNEVDISSLNICTLYNTPLTVVLGSVTSITPIYGDSCSIIPPPPPKLCKLIKSLRVKVRNDDTTGIVEYTNCAGNLATFSVNLTYGINNIDVSSLNICTQVNTPITITTEFNLYSATPTYGDECASTPPTTTLVKLPFGFTADAACFANNTSFWCLDNPDLCTATTLYLSDGTSCLSVVTEGLWLSDNTNVRYWNGTSFEGCSLCT